MEQADTWRQVAATPAALPAVQPAVDTYASAGRLSVSLDVETTRMLLGEVPAAFHAGIHEILLIAFGLAWTRVFGQRMARRSASTWRATGATRSWAPRWTCPAPWGGSPPSTRCLLTVGGLSWAQVIAGEAALGAVIKDAKEQLRALPDPLTYGLLRYLNSDVELGGSDPVIGFNYLGTAGRGGPSLPLICGGSARTAAAHRCQHGGADAAGAHRGAQRRHRRH